jgi:hypothetical protein
MARYYSIQGNNLYMYTTMGDDLIDLNSIPEGLGLFSAEVPWRLTPWAAVTEEAPEEGLRVAEILLKKEGFECSTIDRGTFEDYFLSGDANLLPSLESIVVTEVVPMHQWALDHRPSTQAKPRMRRPSMRRRAPKPIPLQRTSKG